MKKIYQKQFSVEELLSESWKSFTENFNAILQIILIIYVPINIVLYFVPVGESFESMRVYLKITQLLEGLLGILATLAIAFIIKNYIEKKSITVSEAFKKALSKWGVVILTGIIVSIFLFGLTLLLVVPAIIFGVYWSFTTLVVALNDKAYKAAMDHSKSIVKERWWTAVGYFIILGIIGLFVGAFLGITFVFLPENFIATVTADTIVDIVFSFFTVAFVIMFLNFDATKKEVTSTEKIEK
ncbi:MAG: hypothetical protein OEV93_05200 [Candidatus Moranbacteria bacterium]|nr:hypothetical protein [Candidatus Moranbacteria bacterium]